MSEEYSENDDVTCMKPQDNWCWLVLVSSFLCIAAVDGLCFTYGLNIEYMFKNHIFPQLNNTNGPLFVYYVLPGSLLIGFHLYASPLTKFLEYLVNYRTLAIFGSVFTSLVLLSSTFLTSLNQYTYFFGICGGLGCGLLYYPSLEIVSEWFEDRRVLAVGMSVCGSGFGICIFSFLFEPITRALSWKGLYITMASVIFQLTVFATFFRPVEIHQAILHKQGQNDCKKPVRSNEHANSRNPTSVKHRKLKSHPRNLIMTRVVKHKLRQRLCSTGSLDGMIITRDNQIISLPTIKDYEMAIAAAKLYTSQSEIPLSPPESKKKSVNPYGWKKIKITPQMIRTESNKHMAPPSLILSPVQGFTDSGYIRIANALLRKLKVQAFTIPGMACPKLNNLFTRGDIFNSSTHSSHSCVPEFNIKSRIELSPTIRAASSSVSRSHSPDFRLSPKTLQTNAKLASPPAGVSIGPLNLPDNGHTQACSSIEFINPLDPVRDRPLSPTKSILSDCSFRTIYPNTHRAVSQELDRINLNETIKAKIRSQVFHQLNRYGHQHRKHAEKVLEEQPRPSCSFLNAGLSKIPTDQDEDRITRNICPQSKLQAANRFHTKFFSNFLEHDYFPLYNSPTFILLSFALFLHMSVFFVPYHFLPTLLLLQGERLHCKNNLLIMGNKTSFSNSPLAGSRNLLLAVGISQIIGRILSTIFIDGTLNSTLTLKNSRRCLDLGDPKLLNVVTIVLSGSSIGLIPLSVKEFCVSSESFFRSMFPHCGCFTPHILFIYTFIVIYSLSSAITISLRSLVASELIGAQHLVQAFYYLLIFQGTGAIAGPIVMGFSIELISGVRLTPGFLSNPFFQSHQKTWSQNPIAFVFYLSAFTFLLSALCFFLTIHLSEWEARYYANKQLDQLNNCCQNVPPNEVNCDVISLNELKTNSPELDTINCTNCNVESPEDRCKKLSVTSQQSDQSGIEFNVP